jgi:poly-beta-1,6-N-acetyl-D-glucosamine N-deacetylase
MSAQTPLYEGKAKIIYTTDNPEVLLAHFKDDATAFNAQKRGSISGKGEINCTISQVLFQYLENLGIPTHFIASVSPNQMQVKRVQILPLEVVVRNIAAGSLCQQTGLPLGTVLKQPLVEFYYKNDALGDPLLKKYGYPAVFSIYTSGVGVNSGRTHVSWEQLQEMAADPLITIAAHSVTHPEDLRKLPDDKLEREIVESKQILETQLGIPIRYFTYPAGKYDERVAQAVKQAGYQAALTMDDNDERFAGDSESLLAVGRFGQSNLARAMRRFDGSAIAKASGGAKLPTWGKAVDFSAAVAMNKTTIDRTTLMLISGGRPTTIHANSRYQVQEILADTPAIAGVDGGFFSLKFLDSNVMIGPVLSQGENSFVPGNSSDNSKLSGRPLVLISPYTVKFVPFDSSKHNTLEGIQAEMSEVTDAFVASAWLVKDGIGRSRQTFGSLFGFDAQRHRAFWGINQAGQPTIGVTKQPIDSVALGAVLAKAGLHEAVMLDSGASTSLVYKGESLVGYVPRPVPHVVALLPPQSDTEGNCVTAQR